MSCLTTRARQARGAVRPHRSSVALVTLGARKTLTAGSSLFACVAFVSLVSTRAVDTIASITAIQTVLARMTWCSVATRSTITATVQTILAVLARETALARCSCVSFVTRSTDCAVWTSRARWADLAVLACEQENQQRKNESKTRSIKGKNIKLTGLVDFNEKKKYLEVPLAQWVQE